jgi:DNA adenine methylase
MLYMGSKRRIAREILDIILRGRGVNDWYVSPFVGGCNAMDKVAGKRIGADIHFHLIRMWQALQSGWVPPANIDKQEYVRLKNSVDVKEAHLKGFSGFALGWGGQFEATCALDSKGRDYYDERRRNILKQVPFIKGVNFINCSFWQLKIPDGSVVYCDPPYGDSTYKGSGFISGVFWQWVRELSNRCKVYVSEYNAPNDFRCVWSKDIVSTMRSGIKGEGVMRTERLFVYEGGLSDY